MKKIEDYLHLYLGCEVNYSGTVVELFGVHKAYCVIGDLKNIGMVKIHSEDYVRLKPILRPLSDMSEEESLEWENINNQEYEKNKDLNGWSNGTLNDAESTRYLLSKHFDLFNLIPEGLAIDKNQKPII